MGLKIGLDFGGVISFSPDGWAETIREAKMGGHEFFIVSHVQPGEAGQIKARVDFARLAGITDLTFSDLDWYSQKQECGQRKAQLCQENGIEIFIDDDLEMCRSVGDICDRCAALYIPQNLWQVGQRLIEGLSNDYRWR